MKPKTTTFFRHIFWNVLPWMAVILLAASGALFGYQFRAFKADKEKSVETLISERAMHFDRYFTEIKSQLVHISGLSDVRTALLKFQDMSAVEIYKVRNAIADNIGNINIFNPYIEDMIVIGINGFVQNLQTFSSLKSHTDPLEWDSIRSYRPGKSGSFYYTLPYIADYYAEQPHMVISVVLPVRENTVIAGYVQCNLNYENVLHMLLPETGEEDYGTGFTAVNEDGRVMISADAEELGTEMDPLWLTRASASEKGFFTVRDQGTHMVVYRNLDITKWIFMEQVPYRAILRPILHQIVFLLGILLPVSILVMAVILMLLTRRIQKPMEMLKERVETADVESYERPDINYRVEEIQVVADRFEDSMERTKKLIEDVYQEELLRKNAQLEILRNQITPHFLYNSLQLIKAEAILSKNKEISQTVTALANLLRYSMNSQEEVTSAAAELQYIRDFLEIYKRRYVDKFEYDVTWEAEIENCVIPKMILQPLVENSIRHGIQEMKSGGWIEVKAFIENGICVFTVKDNGTGVSREELEKLRQELSGEQPVDVLGIGIINVHQRVRLLCGPDSGIAEIDGCEGGGFSQKLMVHPLGEDVSNV